MFFLLLYIVYFITDLLYGGVQIGPLSPRLIMLALMFMVCIKERALKFDWYCKAYSIFVFFVGLASIVAGYTGEFFRFFVGNYLASYVMYVSTMHLIEKYHKGKILMYFIIALCLVDASLTILQYYGYTEAYYILELARLNVRETLLASMEYNGIMEGHGIAGFFASIVKNGYLMAAFSAFSLYTRDGKLRIHNYVLWFLAIVAIFFVQERSALAAGVVTSVFLAYYFNKNAFSYNKWIYSIFFIIVAIIVVPYIFNYISSGESRYAEMSFDSGGRDTIYANAIDYILSNPLGGYFEYDAIYNKDPHNIFLGALVYGGFFGFIPFIMILLKQSKVLFSIASNFAKGRYDSLNVIFAAAMVTNLINSLVHNHCIVNGSTLTWFIWAGVVATMNNVNGQNYEYMYNSK